MLEAGMEGIRKKIEPPEPFIENVYHFDENELKEKDVETLPEHLGEAIDAFTADQLPSNALGGYISKYLVELKREEFEDYSNFTGESWSESRPKITSWEIDRYLVRC